jgi:hypothetical protein
MSIHIKHAERVIINNYGNITTIYNVSNISILPKPKGGPQHYKNGKQIRKSKHSPSYNNLEKELQPRRRRDAKRKQNPELLTKLNDELSDYMNMRVHVSCESDVDDILIQQYMANK